MSSEIDELLVAEEGESEGDFRPDKTPEEAQARAEELSENYEHIAQVLSRGLVGHRLEVPDADPARVYKWIRDRFEDISKYESLKFRLEKRRDHPGLGMHGKGDDRIIVGDAVLMSCTVETWNYIQRFRVEQNEKRMGGVRKDPVENPRIPTYGNDPGPRVRTLGG